VQDTVDSLGRIDILVNVVGGVNSETGMKVWSRRANSGDDSLPQFMDFHGEVWDDYYELNLKSHVLLSQAVTPYFMKQRSGNIINISSVSGRLPDHAHMPYSAMKAADISITWSLARALAPYNARVNCICPGHVYTPLWDRGATARYDRLKEAAAKGEKLPYNITLEELEKLTPREWWLNYHVKPITPLGRDQTEEDMGRAAVFLASEDAKNITGQTLHVDGGMIMR
jgi:NAD(P)-dependent dehydrogenase (short-subunit alcohol dehydrogenase family)